MRTIAFLELREWRFIEAVFPGDTIRVRTKVLAKEIRGRGKRGEITWQRTLANQEGKPVQEGTSVTLVECRPPHAVSDASEKHE
jgi:acyl dehydratase